MKHTYNKALLIAVLMLVIFAGCKKSFLEIVPKGKLIAQATSDYDGLLNNLNLITIGAANAQIPMGDEVAAIDPYFTATALKTQASFRWDPVLYQPADDAGETLIPMQNIYLCNKIINEVPNATGTDQQKLSIAAEARAGRAWTYFLLINYYGKPYDQATAATDPGFPIVETADVTTTKFTRASVQQVYDFIISDLVTAIPNLPVQITYRTRMSKAAAEGILGKVYMFMGRFTDALPLLNAAITDLANQAIPVRLYDYNVEFNTGGIFFNSSAPTYPLVPSNYESVFAKQATDVWTYSDNEIVTTPQTAALFGATDLRLKFYTNFISGTKISYAVPGLLRKQNALNAQIGVVVPELYLLRAECKCRTNDLAGAVADVQALRVKRMPAAAAPVPAAIASQQMSLLNFILNERIREFAVQGYRWFDMRRLSVDPLFAGATYTHTLYSATGSVTATYQLKQPERFVLQFSPKIMAQNPSLVNNP